MQNGNLLTVALEETFEKEGGIYIPTTKRSFRKLKVIAGDGIEPGKTVYINISLGTNIEIEKEKYIVVNRRDIILIK